MKYVADDGTVCKTKEEMQQINKRVERLLLPDKIARTFGVLYAFEKIEWIRNNITHRGLEKGARLI